jgi:hypothetical protein
LDSLGASLVGSALGGVGGAGRDQSFHQPSFPFFRQRASGYHSRCDPVPHAAAVSRANFLHAPLSGHGDAFGGRGDYNLGNRAFGVIGVISGVQVQAGRRAFVFSEDRRRLPRAEGTDRLSGRSVSYGADAIELAAGRRPGLRLDAVGVWREFWPEVVTAAASPARIAKLVLHDYVPDHVLDELYREARALLYLSSDEGMGLPPLEALARGCPVVCSDIPIFREVCGDAAFYVPLRDTAALASLLERLASGALDAEVARKLELGQQRIQAYGAVRLARDWRLLLDAYASFRAPVVV